MEYKNGFEKLKNFFRELPKNQVLLRDRERPIVDISWIFTEKLDREVIKTAITNIMIKNNPDYKKGCKFLKKDPKDISQINISTNNERLIMQFIGNDGWTKLNVTDRVLETDKKGISTISIEQLEKEIFDVLQKEPLEKILERVELDDLQKEQIMTIFSETTKGEKVTLEGIKQALDKSFDNLTDYYKYLIELKKEHNIHACTIQQREDEGEKHSGLGGRAPTGRLHEIIPFDKRAEVLEGKNPLTKIEVTELDKEGNEIPNSYTVYVYEKCLKEIEQEQDGYLFVCEPLEGNRKTRLAYLTKEEFENFPIQEGEDKFSKITEKFLTMSAKEFLGTKGTQGIKHTTLEAYEKRINFYLQGIRAKGMSNPTQYKEYLQKLYKNPNINLKTKYSKKDILDIAGSALGIDRIAQEAIRGDNQKENS